MMEGWKEYDLTQIIDKFIDYRGKTPAKKSFGIPLVTAKIVKNGRIQDPDEFISEDDYKSWMTRGFPKKNDIILTTEAPLGELAIISDPSIALAQRIITLRPNPDFAHFRFLKYLFESDYGQYLLNSRATGTTVLGIKASELKKIKLKLPPLPTQQKIAKILTTYDDLIENNLQRIKLLEEMAQNVFNELYSTNKEFEEVNLGSLIGHEIGGGWGNDELTDEFNKPAYVIRGTDIDELPNGKLEKVPFRYHKKSNLASRKLQDGDIIFEVSGGSSYEGVAKTLLVTAELLKQFDNAVMPASFCKLVRPSKREYSSFVFLFLRFLRNIRGTEVFEIRSASNIVNYNWTAFLKFQKVKKPNDDVIEKLNAIVEPIYKQIYILGNQNQYLKEARDILLPRLMTGMIDVEKISGQVDNETERELTMAAEDGVEYGKA